MTPEEYYVAPSQEVFDDIKKNAQIIWSSYGNIGGYRDDKLERIDIENVGDNAWYIVSMFDRFNQDQLLRMVKPETADLIHKARGY